MFVTLVTLRVQFLPISHDKNPANYCAHPVRDLHGPAYGDRGYNLSPSPSVRILRHLHGLGTPIGSNLFLPFDWVSYATCTVFSASDQDQ